MRFLRASRLTLMAFALLLLLPTVSDAAAQASPTPSAISYNQALQTLNRLLTEAQRIQGQLDASQFDLDALSAKLGIKADDIVNYVRDNIAFEQYPGELRGAKWTLIGRAGNSIDQAILLATLLSKAGYEIKIEHGTLNPEQAASLLLQMQVPRKTPDPIGDLSALETLIKQMAHTVGMPDAQVQSFLDAFGQTPQISAADQAALDADVNSVMASLDGGGVKLGDPTNLAKLATEASDYFWVSYRKTADDKWTDAHPAFKDASQAPTVTPTESFPSIDAIPASDKQTLSIEPIIERSVNGVLSQKSLGAPITGPASDLAGTPVYFTTLSDSGSASTDPNANINDILNKAQLFMVQFNNSTPDSTSVVFDMHGSLFNLKELKPGEFGYTPETGEVVAGAMASAVAALGDQPTPTPGPTPDLQLTGVWLNVTFTMPGQEPQTIRRTIVDRIGQANRDAGKTTIADPNDGAEVAAELAQNVSLYASVSQSSLAYVTDQYLARLGQIADILRLQLQAKYFPNEDLSVSADQRDAVGTAWSGFGELLAAFDAISNSDPAVVTYRPAPAVVTYRQEIVPSGAANSWELALSVDVLANPRRSYSIAGGSLAVSAQAGVREGVWETHSEHVDDVGSGKAVTYNTMTVMAAAKSQNITIKVVKSDADLSGLDLTPEAMNYLKSDLAAGYVAIIPAKTPTGQPLNGWWRVDPKTGVTLGMLGNGRGTEMSETSVLIRAIACSAAYAFAGQSMLSMAVGCAFAIGGSWYGYRLGASPLVGDIIGSVGAAIGLLVSAYGL